MAEYKDCEELIKHLREIYCSECNNYNGARCRACEAGDIIGMIDDAPAADVVPVIYGEWIYDCNTDEPRCSECGEDAIDGIITPYCPNYGAKMEDETDV